LIDLVKAEQGGWRLVPRFVGGTLLLGETHASYAAQGYAWHPVYGWNYAYRWGMNPYLNSFGGLQFEAWDNPAFLVTNGRILGRPAARGAAALSWGPPQYAASGNSAFSFAPEGQGFISPLPAAGAPVPLLDVGGDQSHIAVRRDFSDSAFWNAAV